MKNFWNEYCRAVQELTHQKLGGMKEVRREWTFDATPLAGFLGLDLSRFTGSTRAWLRFRNRSTGVFYQINDGPWAPAGHLGTETLDQILDQFLRDFEGEPLRGVKHSTAASTLKLADAA